MSGDISAFSHGYGSDNGGWLVYLVVKLHIAQYSLYQRFGVGRIIYRKTAFKPDKVGVEAQQSGENTVKCPHPQLRGHSRADHLLDALPHLFGGLVGKCKSKYTPWFIAMAQQMYNLICEHTCLARPGAGYYQLRAIIVDYGVALLVIQLQKIVIFFWSYHLKITGKSLAHYFIYDDTGRHRHIERADMPELWYAYKCVALFEHLKRMPASSAPITMATGPV